MSKYSNKFSCGTGCVGYAHKFYSAETVAEKCVSEPEFYSYLVKN